MKMHYHQFTRWLPRGRKRRIVVQTLNFIISEVIWDRSLKFGTYTHLNSMYICSKFHWNMKRWVSGMSHFDVEFPVLKWCHAKCAHGGRGATLNELRRSGYWVINGNSAVQSKLFKCIQCRRLRGKLGIQKMADLPSSRLMEVPPFTYCGVGMFGAFIIKQR